jgi:hypothetical protein
MRNGDFWGWLAYGSLWVAGSIIAADAGIKMASDLQDRVPLFKRLIGSRLWPFTPLILLIAATLILFSKEYGLVGSSDITFPWHNQPPHIMVTDKTFRNEIVLLDGHFYKNCKFYNVTFEFNGAEPTGLEHNDIFAPIVLKTQNPSVGTVMLLFQGLGMLSNTISVEVPPGSIVNPPIIKP